MKETEKSLQVSYEQSGALGGGSGDSDAKSGSLWGPQVRGGPRGRGLRAAGAPGPRSPGRYQLRSAPLSSAQLRRSTRSSAVSSSIRKPVKGRMFACPGPVSEVLCGCPEPTKISDCPPSRRRPLQPLQRCSPFLILRPRAVSKTQRFRRCRRNTQGKGKCGESG